MLLPEAEVWTAVAMSLRDLTIPKRQTMQRGTRKIGFLQTANKSAAFVGLSVNRFRAEFHSRSVGKEATRTSCESTSKSCRLMRKRCKRAEIFRSDRHGRGAAARHAVPLTLGSSKKFGAPPNEGAVIAQCFSNYHGFCGLLYRQTSGMAAFSVLSKK